MDRAPLIQPPHRWNLNIVHQDSMARLAKFFVRAVRRCRICDRLRGYARTIHRGSKKRMSNAARNHRWCCIYLVGPFRRRWVGVMMVMLE